MCMYIYMCVCVRVCVTLCLPMHLGILYVDLPHQSATTCNRTAIGVSDRELRASWTLTSFTLVRTTFVPLPGFLALRGNAAPMSLISHAWGWHCKSLPPHALQLFWREVAFCKSAILGIHHIYFAR